MCKKFYKILIILFFCSNAYARNYEFNNLIVFGDSLSDTGNLSFNTPYGVINSKVVAGNNKVYVEYLSKIFTGKSILPAKDGGTNYAISNAIVNADFLPNNIPYDIKNTAIKTQFDKYLENHKIIPNNLYIIWGGGNDLGSAAFNPGNLLYIGYRKVSFSVVNFFIIDSFNFIAKILDNEFKSIDNIKYNPITDINLSPANFYITKMSQELINRGAKYIIVPNLFDAGTAPRFIFPETILSIVSQYLLDTDPNNKNLSLQKILLPFGLNKLIYNTFNAILVIESQSYFNHLNKKNNIPLAGQSGREFILNNLHNRYSKLRLGNLAVKLADLFTLATRSFNYFLDLQLSLLDSKIIYVDIYSLFNEIINNPTLYGFNDILLPTCSAVFAANDPACKNELSGVYHPEKTYLFSDGVHPSPQMHLIYAQYMESIFNAPVLVSSITYQLANLNKSSQEYLFNQLINLSPTTNKFTPFIAITGDIQKIPAKYNYNSKTTLNNALNIGLAYALDNNFIIGTSASVSYANSHPFNNFKYQYNSQIFNLFTKYNFNNNFWIADSFTFGNITANNITRNITLGKAIHIQKSQTDGANIGFNITTGADFNYNQNLKITPYIAFDLNNYRINHFSENYDNSTAMKFARTSTTFKQLKTALRANYKNNAFLELGITNPIAYQPIKIKSSLKNVKTAFNREIYFNDKTTFNFSFGFNKQFNHALLLNLNLNYNFNNHNYKQLQYSLGFNAKF